MITTMEEALAMQGTEFIYESNGDRVKAFVKKLDPDKGLSCWSLSATTRDGYEFPLRTEEEKREQGICLIGIDFNNTWRKEHQIQKAFRYLTIIKETGFFTTELGGGAEHVDCPI